jgi:hypothetical protein
MLLIAGHIALQERVGHKIWILSLDIYRSSAKARTLERGALPPIKNDLYLDLNITFHVHEEKTVARLKDIRGAAPVPFGGWVLWLSLYQRYISQF